MFQIKAKILYNKEVRLSYFRCVLAAPLIARSACPGQFVNIKVSDSLDPILRRPFSIHRVREQRAGSREQIEILYEVIGKGTEILSQREAGEYLDIIGPLGSGFDSPGTMGEGRGAILVAGGMGIAPLFFLLEKIKKDYPLPALRDPASYGIALRENAIRYTLVLIGARTKNQVFCEREFRGLGCGVKIATDDGSAGFKGRVTDLLKHLLRTMDYGLWTIYACGPRPMLKEISRISQQFNIPAQVSLEAHLACGIGACLGCVVNTRAGYQRVCKEGPVFEAQDIVW